ncbi:hypothetical protein DFH05DRAFT_1458009 [Lentinula detonsa]|uniref:Uncharacterized protein n=1 Tax=Lentinula detonsa TaxID=2804962 RepID=A0A9W8U0R6_9AGAR|nr:hypothetical protein DFH05DRAFT_1458009 [Lentinula detonsa]KAJ3988329.1 hypothetical protein F5890DRAFT_1491940 [Lentinula detonsa]
MKFMTALFAAGAAVISVSSVPIRRDVDPNLVPQFGLAADINPDGTGNCDGINGPNGQPILIPCSCPPDRDTFIADLNANVAAGHAVNNPSIAVSFPSDNSQASQLARIDAALVTLQNLNGAGVGCPASSTTFVAQQAAIQAGSSVAAAPASTSVAAAPAATASAPATGGVDVSLVPEFGVTAGQSPDGTGNCIGINNIKIPCSCPPDRDTFIADLNANVAAGHATNNPSVSVSFPTGQSNADAATRIEAAIVTLQNLNGAGVGCPAASTTFSAQLAAVQ